MADDREMTEGAPPSHIHIEKGKPVNWLAWLALALGVLALIWALTRHKEAATTTETVSNTAAAPIAATGSTVAATTTASVGALGAYLAGSEAAPRTFAFDTMHFATASSELTAADKTTVEDVAGVLGKYPTTNVKIVGYADARGNAADNAKLGIDRASSVKVALTAKGVDGSRIATGSGGDADPVDTNTTASGQAENRRTELVVVNR
ncbi:OmpA family protein (plasmid) [Polymorphobacter sp. PAMC 29334]|uniref:OmpA family protein n=1 Tax=Polymorphobacter sp. PAMC 29334 TaxID=2862331 RepID=UPI001C67C5BC|nr:OmpA family protein [Polymorphobacter sp. PAMC 29334]QYE37149.1 OmpA family protein [Polymorphobacter sp. PAMC 29334]